MNQGRIRVLALMLADAVCISFCWAVAVVGYRLVGFGTYDIGDCLRAWPVILLFLGVNFSAKVYHGRGVYPGMPVSPVEELRRLVLSAVATHLTVMAFLGFGRNVESISRFVLIFAGVSTALSAQIFRDLMRRALFRVGIGQIPAFVAGDGVAAARLVASFADNPYWGFRIVRTFTGDELRGIVSAAEAAGVRHVFCCYRDERFFRAQMPEMVRWFSYIEYLPTPYAFPLSDAQALSVDGLGGLEMVNQRRLRLLKAEKAVFDFALTILIFVMALPVFIIVPLLIWCSDRGPVFYRARRLGKNGRPIRIWKFRTMYVDADERLQNLLEQDPSLAAEFEKSFKLRNDPRVTPLGRFLRRTSIDELPQLLNVFTRDMSLIGPRPIVEKETQYYGEAAELFFSVKPGITGLWQSSGRSDTDYPTRVALDVRYLLNWSPWLDLWIVFRTVVAVVTMRGSC